MKILVVSLLRVGDIIMSAPVIAGLRARYPHSEIHLLVNSQFKGLAPLLNAPPFATVDRMIGFDRELMQKGLGSPDVPVFYSFERLVSLVDMLNGEGYDLAINLTHNRLSGWLLSLIEAKNKNGLYFDSQGRASFGSSWFRHLNSQVDAEGRETFHFADFFKFALGFEELPTLSTCLSETEKGRKEAQAVLDRFPNDVDGLLAVQALTSDSKKDWGLDRFADTVTRFAARHPRSGVIILGAPFEKTKLEPLISCLTGRGINAQLAPVGFEAAFSLLKQVRLLLTGDTSIKHLASAAGTPVVEICLGSADPYRTGAYRHGSIIVMSKEACAPCSHSKACHRDRQFCSSRIPVDLISMVASEAFEGRDFQLSAIAREYRDEAEVLRVENSDTMFWSAVPVLEPFSEASVGRWIDLACRKLWLQSQQSRNSLMLGSEGLRLSRFLRILHPKVSEFEWKDLFSQFERQSEQVEGRINGLKTGIRVLHGCYEDPRRMQDYVKGLISLRERIRHSPLLASFRSSLELVIEDDVSPPFTRFRRIVEVVSEIERRTDIHLRLVRALGKQINESMQMDKSLSLMN
jgi:ADP-heptose:LPS heptosyltransferase